MGSLIEINPYRCNFINKDKVKYGTDIFLHRGYWRQNLNVDYSLQSSPVEGQTHFVTLSAPLKIKVHENIWIYYDTPLAYYNGYDGAEEIFRIRFCLGTVSKVVTLTDENVTIEFIVLKTEMIKQILSREESFNYLSEWEDFFKSFVNSYSHGSTFSVQKLQDYYYVSCSLQGDYGQNCLIGENSGLYYAVMMNEWSFQQDFIFGGKFGLSKPFSEFILEHSEVAHKIYFNGKLFINLKASSFYDTANPHQWCVGILKELMRLLSKSELLIVGSGNKTFSIKDNTEYKEWVKNQFKGNFINCLE